MIHPRVDCNPSDADPDGPIMPDCSRNGTRPERKALSSALPPSPPSSVSQPLMSRHFSLESQGFDGAALKKLATPDPTSVVIPLGAGRPSPDLYPWPCSPSSSSPSFSSSSPDHGVILRDSGSSTLASAFDYGYATGSPEIVEFMHEHVRMVHNPPYPGWATCMSSGSTSALEIALRIFCDRGDAVLAEKYTYPGFLEVASLVGLEVVAVDMDAQGICPESLRGLLRNWAADDKGLENGRRKRRPTVLYTIPSGHNPTGATQTAQRKRDIYDIAEEFDLVIVEDDPYYFLQLDSPQRQQRQNHVNGSGPYSTSIVPSYLSLDKSGRTIRLDSVSKVLAPGLRIGWVTAHQTVIDKFAAYHEICTAFPSGPAQLLLSDLLCENWGHAGFASWLGQLSARYRARRDIMVEACEKYLPKCVCSWGFPSCGMFIWVKVELESAHHHFNGKTDEEGLVANVESNVLSRAMENGVQIASGSWFRPLPPAHSSSFTENSKGNAAAFFRLTYAAADGMTLAKGVELFANALREELSLS